jgi:hypothetical protein
MVAVAQWYGKARSDAMADGRALEISSGKFDPRTCEGYVYRTIIDGSAPQPFSRAVCSKKER